MTPTYTILEVLNLIEGASATEMLNLVKVIQDDLALYSKAEYIVIMDHIVKRREQLEALAKQ